MIVVSGHRRTGTSMMVDALHKAGLPLIYMPELEDLDSVPDDEGYIPSPGGLREVGYNNTFRADFLRGVATEDVAVIKILYDAILFLPKGDWKIIFMHRDPEEIDASCKRVDEYIAFNQARNSGRRERYEFDKRQKSLEKSHKGLLFSVYRPYSQANVDHVLGIMESRKDVDLIQVNYRDVIDNPTAVFNRIKHTPLGKVRIPIDVDKAVAIINPDFYRIRK